MMRKYIPAICMCFLMLGTSAQVTFPKNDVNDNRPAVYAFTNARIVQDHKSTIPNGTLVIKEGKILSVGAQVTVPKGAITSDMNGKTIYPAFIDPHSSYGLPKAERSRFSGSPQYETNKDGAFGWNEAIKADFNAINEFDIELKDANKLRKAGFGAVVSFKNDGVVRGSSVFALTGDGPVQEVVLNPRSSAHFSFNKGSSRQLYPTSIMGYAALLRQTFYDADWYARGGRNELTNQSLASFNELKKLPVIFEANGGRARVLLADKIGDEFGMQFIIKGNGDEYQRINDIRATGASLILPLDFPKAYDVDDPLAALDISIADLKHWENAPGNASVVSKAGIEFAFSSDGLKDVNDYLENVRKSVKYGLSESDALKAMTSTPAKMVRMDNRIGSIQQGKVANFIVTDGSLFENGTKILETWVDGIQYAHDLENAISFEGNYELLIDGNTYGLEIKGSGKGMKASLKVSDSTSLNGNASNANGRFTLTFSTDSPAATYRLSGWKTGNNLSGNGQKDNMDWLNWSATYTGQIETEDKKEDDETASLGDLIYPFRAFGWVEEPSAGSFLLKNATVWTMESDDILENADVLISDGKISAVGKNLTPGSAKVIDATGKHITPGIIDEHSHIGLYGVNESSHSITSEVRMADAIDADDIDIYRQLAGGVTAAQLLHGSANPVGGQSAIVKLRWGRTAEEMRIKGADEYIKFALGENVKQSNRSGQWVTRFPQTRMGVEQVYVNAFTEAYAYDKEWKAFNGLSAKAKSQQVPPRRDLQLEALAEILNEERFITCHSYVQSEINMLMKVAEQFDFRVNTFTHILEGYKVADKMATHGVGGSTFSDWWAYKYEVRDAIPYNAALMTQAGVTVAINSDDAEMARRLNQEAAKSVKYGGMDEIEALKMVTINPAKLLHLDHRMGSLKAGKDADVVIWSDHPLSIYAKSEMTIVDGVIYYDLESDKERTDWMQAERARIIEKMKGVKKNGGSTQSPRSREKHVFHCEEQIGTF